jgi:hypothetical protein
MMRSASNFSLALMSVSASLRVTSSGVISLRVYKLSTVMNLNLYSPLSEAYSSKPQKIRVLSESWVNKYIYCPCCGGGLSFGLKFTSNGFFAFFKA